MTTLPNIPQDYYDNNKERFDADSTGVILDPKKCDHYFVRIASTTVECRDCTAGWVDMGKWKIEDGKILE